MNTIDQHGLTTDKIIEKHTLWNFFLRFVDVYKHDVINDLIKNGPVRGRNSSISSADGIGLGHHGPKYCPKCNQEAILEYGEFYWKRVHQISGVLVCPTHNCFLESISKQAPNSPRKEHLYIPGHTGTMITNARGNSDKLLFAVSQFIQKILNGEIKIEFDFTKAFDQKIQNHPKVNHRRLLTGFKYFYKETFSRYLELEESKFLIEPKSMFNPIQQILFQYMIQEVPLHRILDGWYPPQSPPDQLLLLE